MAKSDTFYSGPAKVTIAGTITTSPAVEVQFKPGTVEYPATGGGAVSGYSAPVKGIVVLIRDLGLDLTRLSWASGFGGSSISSSGGTRKLSGDLSISTCPVYDNPFVEWKNDAGRTYKLTLTRGQVIPQDQAMRFAEGTAVEYSYGLVMVEPPVGTIGFTLEESAVPA